MDEVSEELQSSDFEPLAFELEFGADGQLPAITIREENGTARVVGKVDRVDGWLHDGKLYLRVVDYKTGKKSFDLAELRYGLGLQMLLYLFTLKEEGQMLFGGHEIVPAGVLYTPAREPMLRCARDTEPERIEKALKKELRRSGMVLEDPAVLQAMEHSALEEPSYLPIAVKKDGTVTGNLASEGQFEKLARYVDRVLREITGDTFADVTERELYEAANVAQPGLIRCDADELTYCLHIMIRYELEKAFMNGEITVDEIPALWNQKYQDYLGVAVPDDAQGCLQDVHWTMPAGYFPSYALGSAYGVQILRTMEKDFNVFACAARGDLLPIRDWLKEHVFSIASVTTPDEWLRAITGESLNPDYFLTYLEEKFSALYALA